MKPLRVKVAGNYLFTLWFFFVLILLFGLFLLYSRAYLFGLVFVVIANLFLAPMLRLGPLEMTQEYIRIRLPIGCFEIAWDEIEWIEYSSFETFMVLHGEKKKLVIYGYSLWSGREKDEFFELLRHRIEEREISLVETGKSHWQISRGTRVKEFL